MTNPIRVLLADDHPIFRYGLRAVLSSDPDVELVAEASTGEEAVDLAVELHPDVVLMDLTMPGINGIEATRRLRELDPDIGVVVLTMFDDQASVLGALRAGARGYLVKGADRDEILRAIRAAAAAEAILSPTAAKHLVSQLAAPQAARTTFPDLTDREHEILEMIAAGLTNPAITRKLVLSPKTVRNYVSTILTKLGADSRDDAIRTAQAAGLGRAGVPASPSSEAVSVRRPRQTAERVLATVLFTDVVDSTGHAVVRGDNAWMGVLGRHREAVRSQLVGHRGREVVTTGDGFLATFDGPARAVQCAMAIVAGSRGFGIEIRAGLHTGEIELTSDDVGGIAVHIASRVCALARPGEVLVSSTVKDLVAGSGLRFDDQGPRKLRGMPDEWRLFAVRS